MLNSFNARLVFLFLSPSSYLGSIGVETPDLNIRLMASILPHSWNRDFKAEYQKQRNIGGGAENAQFTEMGTGF